MKIRGNTVGTTTPRPDWNQSNPRKADFILNKPDAVLFAAQSLTEAQMDQARKNIGAVSNSLFSGFATDLDQRTSNNTTAISNINTELRNIGTDIGDINSAIGSINADMGDIDTALDAIIAMQESIIGGESV